MVSHTTRLVCYAIPLCPDPSHPDATRYPRSNSSSVSRMQMSGCLHPQTFRPGRRRHHWSQLPPRRYFAVCLLDSGTRRPCIFRRPLPALYHVPCTVRALVVPV
eukprot:scaffold37918_cov54-Phaeocystis_antarctica.AAC.3